RAMCSRTRPEECTEPRRPSPLPRQHLGRAGFVRVNRIERELDEQSGLVERAGQLHAQDEAGRGVELDAAADAVVHVAEARIAQVVLDPTGVEEQVSADFLRDRILVLGSAEPEPAIAEAIARIAA